jgi:hypothetical protein
MPIAVLGGSCETVFAGQRGVLGTSADFYPADDQWFTPMIQVGYTRVVATCRAIRASSR